jgi:hypothetical protein
MFPKDVKINFPKIRNNIFKKKKIVSTFCFQKWSTNVLDSSEGFQILLTQV